MNEYIPLLIALVAGPITAVAANAFAKRKVETDNTKTMTDIALSLVAPLQAEITSLKMELVAVRAAHKASEDEKHLIMQWSVTLVEHLVGVGERPHTFEEFKQQNGHS